MGRLDAPPDVLEIFLGPGEFYFGEERTRIRTLLGSCVAVLLWHPQRRIGGMCHFMLPTRPRRGSEDAPDGRYADEAMQLFMAQLHRTATLPGEYRVRVFGGGRMFRDGRNDRGLAGIPERNMEAAQALLAREGFHVEAQDLGGQAHRNIVFDLWSGDAWVRRAPHRGMAGP